MLQFALLAMQAAGMIMDYQATQDQIELGRMGSQLEKAAIEANIQMTRAQTEDASVRSLQKLRQSLGTQIAMQAARGTASNAGSAFSIFTESVHNYNEDERARRMNLLAKESELRAQGVLSGLHQLASETELGQKMQQRMFNNFPISSLISFVGGGGGGIDAAVSAGVDQGFGMASI